MRAGGLLPLLPPAPFGRCLGLRGRPERETVRTSSEDRWERLAERVSAVLPCETDEDRERLLELLGHLTVPELAALVEALRRHGVQPPVRSR